MGEIPTALQQQMDAVQAAAQAEQSGVTQPVTTPTQEPTATVTPPTQTQQPTADLASGAQALGRNPAQAAPGEDWKHKFDVINGKYVAETRNLRDENAGLQQRLEELERSGTTATANATPDDVTDEEVNSLIAADQIQEWGMDYWKQQIALQRNMSSTNTADASRMERIEEQFQSQRLDAFYASLVQRVPDWEQINSTPEWNAFLAEREPTSGVSYNALLSDANNNGDVDRVANLFERFRSSGSGSSNRPNQGFVPPSNVPSQTPVGQMTIQEWEQQMSGLSSGGLSPTEIHLKQTELLTAMQEGRVTGAQAPESASANWV